MNKRIIMLMVAALALLSASGQVNFIGGQYRVLEVTPDKASTGLDMIYVVYDTEDVTMSFNSQSGERAVWYSFDSRGAAYREPIQAVKWDGFSTVLEHVVPNTGYVIEEGGVDVFYCWVVNYADYFLELNDFFIINDNPCSFIGFRVDGSAPRIPYASITGHDQELDREIKLTYNTLEWKDSLHWQQTQVVESFESLEGSIGITPPLCDTEFVLSGDRFLKEWDLEKFLDDVFYSSQSTQAVGCNATAVQDNVTEETSGGLGGSAPAHIVFTGYPTEAVVYRVWEMATDQDFENVILQFNQDEVDYTFNETGIYYMRYMVANADGSCEAYSDTYTINVSESQLGDETGRLPNVLVLGQGEWKVPHKSIIEFHCWIFNRWGNQVYEFTDPESGWDGMYHGKYVDAGVYYCVVTATGSDGQKYKKRGDISVLRYKGSEGTSNGVDTGAAL